DQTRPTYAAILPEEHRRAETRTFMTYPEWHIVHAYEDYAQVIATGDPHDYGYVSSVTGFWGSLCALSKTSGEHGVIDWPTKRMVYVIGSSFTLELAAKAAYEETVGRLITLMRGDDRAPLDDLSAKQADSYAEFLQQVPWFEWRWREDAATLASDPADTLRDRERRFALGVEYGVKAAYADALVKAMEGMEPDALTLRMVVTGLDAAAVTNFENVVLISEMAEGLELEAPRYRILTGILEAMSMDGAEFVEIAGNDDILFTALSDAPSHPDAMFSTPRQGFADHRHLITVPVSELADTLRGLDAAGLRLEHIHDY
ncbi:MAG: hypothetical protein AAGO57_07670, partial [Pseudomonadota bacterium]